MGADLGRLVEAAMGARTFEADSDGMRDVVRAILHELKELSEETRKVVLDDFFNDVPSTTLYREDCKEFGLPFFGAVIDHILKDTGQ